MFSVEAVGKATGLLKYEIKAKLYLHEWMGARIVCIPLVMGLARIRGK